MVGLSPSLAGGKMRYYYEILKNNRFSAGYIEASSDNDAISRVKTDLQNSVVFLQRCDNEVVLLDSWPKN